MKTNFKSLCKSNSFKNAKSLTQYKILLTIAHSIKVKSAACTSAQWYSYKCKCREKI